MGTSPYDDGGAPPWGSSDSVGQGGYQPRDVEPDPDVLRCPVCRGVHFREEEGRLQTRWGMGSHILTMKICRRCGNVLFFYDTSGFAM